MTFPKNKTWRSEKHRRLIASLNCAECGKYGPSQCAHINFGKGFGLKVSDALTFPLCPDCHRNHNQGGHITKQERWLKEWNLLDATRAELIARNQWLIEEQYQKDIQPLANVVHPEVA